MSQRFRLLSFVSCDFSDDCWSDVEIVQALVIANAVPDAEWRQYLTTWKALSVTAQMRLADVAGEVRAEHPAIVQLLLALLDSPDLDVKVASLDIEFDQYEEPAAFGLIRCPESSATLRAPRQAGRPSPHFVDA